MKERIALAYNLSNGRVLEDPRFLICTELLHIPAPQVALPSFARTVTKYMDVARRAISFDQLVRTGVPYKGRKARINATSILTEVMAGPKRTWATTTEQLADEKYPNWRELFEETGKRLPPDVRRALEPRAAWEPERPTFIKALLEWLNAGISPEAVTELSSRLDAVLEFTIFVVREFLLGNYSLTKHHSDVFDQFQLQHLAIDRFVIVTGDRDLSKRTENSTQASRIMSFEQFLQTL